MDILIRLAADGLIIVIFLTAIFTFMLKIPRNLWWYWGWRIVLGGLTAYLAAKLIGHFYQPEMLRPFEQQNVDPKAAYLPNPGFPSDHMLFATFLTLSVWFSTRHKKLFIALATMTIIMGIGRVLALVHTPLDIIGGLLIGSLSALWYRRRPENIVQ